MTGLLIATCVMLALGIVFTWLELKDYLAEDLPSPNGAPTEQPRSPEETNSPAETNGGALVLPHKAST
jgi:hypothetical protein